MHLHHLGPAVGERTRFVEGDAFDLGQPLKRIPFTDQNPEFRGVANRGHDRGRGGKH